VVKVRFSAEEGAAPSEVELRPTVTSLPAPMFAYTYQIVDNRNGNGDGQLSRGEGATLYLDVTNTGKGASRETQALLRNVSGDGVLLHAGRFDISNMRPSDRRQVAFTFDVLDTLPEDEVRLEVRIVDQDLRVGASEKIELPVIKGGLFVNPATGLAKLRTRAAVSAQPLATAGTFGNLEAGAIVKRLGVFGSYTKVALGAERFGFVDTSALEAVAAGAEHVQFHPALTHSPPLLEVAPSSLATSDSKIRIRGSARDADRVLDAYMFVGSQKVFYQSNRRGTDPRTMSFDQEVTLSPGINVITVVARENEDVATPYTVVVRRDGPNGEALPTPKGESFASDWVFTPRSE
jgi:carboxyl-terminal processing protease